MTCRPSDPVGWIVHAHGGHSMCSTGSHRRLAGHLAAATGHTVALVACRRAPEHRWTAAIDDVDAVARSFGEPVMVSGESAGGGIAAAVVARLAGTGVASRLVLLSPWLDRTLGAESMRVNATSDLFVTREGLADEIFEEADRTAPEASPLFGQLSGLPATLVQVAADEVLLDDSVRYAAAGRAAGAHLELEVVPGVHHAWHRPPETWPRRMPRCAGSVRSSEPRVDTASAGKAFSRRTGGRSTRRPTRRPPLPRPPT
ncbi:MAG: alpha/beta hydrolase fold domain-containing protein [Acidimicrobiales bacterium]